MNAKQSNLAGTVAGLPKKPAHEREAVVPEEKPSVRQTLYLPRRVHDQIRDAAHARRISQQEIFRQALNLWFLQEGLESWEALSEK